MARDSWTDERLDDLNHRVDEGFGEIREEFRALRGEMRGEFQAVRGEIAAINRNFVRLWLTSLAGFAVTIATILAHG